MGIEGQSYVIVALMVFFLVSSVWIGVSLSIIGFLSFLFFMDVPATSVLANIFWNNTNGSSMFALPLFILMGELLFKSDVSEKLFDGLAPWLDRIPGRLIHVNIFASTIFAAVSGSSAATTATVGKITLPELRKRNYDEKLYLGSLAGAGTLGFLIPPSMMMIVYGIAADVSIGQLFIAGLIPGLMIAGSFSLYVIIRCILNPKLAPADAQQYTWHDRIKAVPLLLPVISLVILVLGSIYMGWTTPTEAAVIGVLGAGFLAHRANSLTFEVLEKAIMSTVKTTSMIMLVICGAVYLSVVVGYLGIPIALTTWISTFGISPYTLIGILVIMYTLLGCVIEGFSMIVMTLPIVLPMITHAGFDPLWFGIFMVIMIQIANFTPPVGFNLFIINSMVKADIWTIARATIPFFILMLVIIATLTVFPDIVLFLPRYMAGG